jgi:hypothetical protein
VALLALTLCLNYPLGVNINAALVSGLGVARVVDS